MKNKLKYLMPSIGILGVLFGRILNRVLGHYFENNASSIVVAVCIVIIFCIILLLIIIRLYIAAIGFFVMTIPLIVLGIGLYLGNMDITGLGIVLTFFISLILLIVMKRYNINK